MSYVIKIRLKEILEERHMKQKQLAETVTNSFVAEKLGLAPSNACNVTQSSLMFSTRKTV